MNPSVGIDKRVFVDGPETVVLAEEGLIQGSASEIFERGIRADHALKC